MTNGRRALSLDVSRGWSGLRVALGERLDDGWVARGYEQVALDVDGLERIVGDLQFLLGRANLVGEMGPAAGEEIIRLATLLFDVLVPPAVKPVLRRGRGELVLRLDESLHHLPWELLHTGEAFLARQYALSREIVVQGIVEPPLRRPVAGNHRVLVVADPRSDLPAAEREGAALCSAFAARRDVELGVLAAQVGRAALRESLREYDLVHLAGHAEWDRDGGGWLLSDGRFEPEDVRRLQGTRPMPALVFANACSSGASARPDTDGMARALLAAGTVNYIGTQWDIPDDIGILFAEAFYARLLRGERIGEAMRQARVELAERFGEGTALWGSYVLYGPPARRYFAPQVALELPRSPAGERAARSPIEPAPMLRGAVLLAEEGGSLESPRPRHRRWSSWVRSGAGLVLAAAIGGGLAAHAVRGSTAASLGEAVASVPRTGDDAAITTTVRTERAERPVAAAIGAQLSVIAQIRDAQGHLREVHLHDGDALHSGDRLRVVFETESDAHAYVFYVDAAAQAELVFPSVDGDAGEISGGVEVALPAADGWFWLDARPGRAAFLLAVSERPLEGLPTLVADLEALRAEQMLAVPHSGLRASPLDTMRARIERDVDQVVAFEIDQRP